MKLLHAASLVLALSSWVLADQAGTPKKEDVPKNINLLKTSPSAQVRATAAEQLGLRGAIKIADVENAIEPLMNALKSDKEAVVRKAAAKALGDIAPKPMETVPALTEALKSDKAMNVKLAVVDALAKFGAEARSALPTIREFAKEQDSNKKTKQQIALAIKTISGTKKN